MKRKTLLLMLLMALFSSGAWAQTLYTSYTYDNGTSHYASSQSPAKLIDNVKSGDSKWCVTQFTSWSPIYVEFHSTQPIIPVGYVMTTGGDCSSYTGRNPRSWVIKAKRNSGDSWTTIETQSSNTTLQDVNLRDYTFNLNNSTEYQYFRFEVSTIANTGSGYNVFQLTELQFLVNNGGGGGSGTTVSWGSISDNNGSSDELAISPIGRHYGWEYKVYCYRPNTLPFSGDITQIGFLPSTSQSTPGTASSSITVNGVSDSNPMQIWMKEVDGNTSLDANTTFATYASGATKVYSGNIPATTSGTMNHFSLSTSFSHSQENSLLILVRTKSNSNSGDGALYCYNKILTGGVNLAWSNRQDSSDPGISVSGSVTQNKLPVLEVTYNSNTQTCEGFESDLGGWISTAQDDSYKWARKTGTGGGSYNSAGEGSYNVGAYKSSRINKYTYLTYCADLSSCTDIYISYKYINPAWSSDIDYIYLQTSTDGTNYTNLKSHTSSHTSWTQESNVSIPNGTKYIRFAAYGKYGYGVGLDEICLEYSGSPTYITEIASVDDWNAFCAAVNSGYSYSGKTVTMTADVGTVNTICGKLTGVNDTTPKAFSGTFDGGGHTLTVNYTDQPRFAAPFKFLDGATIRNLRTSGTITGSSNDDGKVIAGLVGVSKGTTNIIGCSSNVNITSYYNNGDDVALSGLVAAINGGTLTVEGCAFEGSLTASTSNNNHNGGIVGYWYSGTHVYVRNTVFAPTALNVTTGDTGYSFTIARTTNNAQVTIENCYYTQVLGNAQGKQRYTITGQNPATVAMSGTETDYGASGIKAYKDGSTQLPGLVYNGTIIAGSSETVNLSLGYTGSGILSGYQASNGTLSGNALTGSNDAYTLSSITANSVITAASFQDAYLIDFETAALDQFGFVNDGSYPWVVTDCSNSTNSVAPYAGSYCMMSGNYNVANTESAMQMTVEFTSPGSISFYWLSSGEGSSWDYGKFYVNGSQITSTNVASWNQYTYPVTAGTYTFKWAYRKDGSVDSNDDRLYVDNIVFASNGNFVAVIPDPTVGGTATVGNNGAQGIFVADGGSTALTATPASGYHLVNWTENGSTLSSSNPYMLSNITANHVVKANFSNTCTLTTSVNSSEGGSITCSPTAANGVYNYGTQVQLTATPNTGYQFTGWMVDGSSAGSTNPYAITMNADHNVVANFALQSFQITVNAGTGGTTTGSGTFNYGASCTVTATANTGYVFSGWYENNSLVSPNASYTFTVTSARTLEANFTANTYNVTYTNGGNGSCSGVATASYGSTVMVTATADTGYELSTLTYTPAGGTAVDITSSRQFTMPAGDVTVNATFTAINYTITYTNDGNGSCSGIATANMGDVVTVTVTPASGYGISTLTYTPAGGTAVDITSSQQFTMPASAVTVHATFTQAVRIITVSADPAGTGTVSGGGNYLQGASCTVTALANAGYSFQYWHENGNPTAVSTDATYTFTVTGDRNLVAHFDPDRTLTTNATPIEGGWVTADVASTIGTITVGTGTATISNTPYATGSYKSYQQCLYKANEINGSGWITSISYEIKGNTNVQTNHIEIYMKNSSLTSFAGTSNSNFETVTASNKVFDGDWTITNVDGWSTIILDTPFYYDGTSSLMIGIHENTNQNKTANFVYTSVNNTRLNTYGPQNTCPDPNPLDPSTFSASGLSKARGSERANVRLGFGTYHNGESIALTAHANPGYQFTGWTVDGTADGNTNPYTVTMNANHNVVANFEARWTFVHAGNWNVPTNWLPVGQPGASDDVYIEAAAIIPANCTAEANTVTINSGGTITIADGGQLKHNNTGVVATVQRNVTAYGAGNAQTRQGYILYTSPVTSAVTNFTGIFAADQNDHEDLYYFDYSHYNNNELKEWVRVTNSVSEVIPHVPSGYPANYISGYIYARQNGTTISTPVGTVRPSNSNYNIPLRYTANGTERFNGWNLIGNPFVCNAYMTAYDGNNNELNYYVLNGNGDDFTPASSTNAVSPTGAIMVKATGANQQVTASRTAPPSRSGILNVDVASRASRAATGDRARLRFGNGVALEKFQFDPNHTRVSIPVDGTDYAVVYVEPTGEVPVNFKAEENGRYSITVSNEAVNFSYLHLIDNMTGDDTDLLKTPSYGFEAKTTDYESRFKIVFATSEGEGDEPFAFYSNGVWVINNEGDGMLQLVDVLGHVLCNDRISGATTKAIDAAPGVYMFRLINGDSVRVQKIVVKR